MLVRLLLVSIATAGLAPAEAATPALAGTTFVRAKHAAVLPVRVPRTVWVSDIIISGSGGVVLVSSADDVIALLWRGDGKAFAVSDDFAPIKAGPYRMYATSGTSMTLRFSGLRGVRKLSPTLRVPFVTKRIQPGVVLPGDQAVYWGGASAATGRGLMFSALNVASMTHVVGDYRMCLKRGGAPPGGWLPGCPGADVTVDAPVAEAGAPWDRTFISYAQVGSGTWGMGFSYASASLIRSVHAEAWWITF